MFRESVCPFASFQNADISYLSDGFDDGYVRNKLVEYNEKIRQNMQKKLAKVFAMPEYESFDDFRADGYEVFARNLLPFTRNNERALVRFPGVGDFFWFAVSKYYPENYFRFAPNNMIVVTSRDFFPVDDERVFYFTLNKAVEKSLGYNPFSNELPKNHRVTDEYEAFVSNYARLVMSPLHELYEASQFEFMCGDLVGVLKAEGAIGLEK